MKNLFTYSITALFIFSAFSCSQDETLNSDETLTPELSAVTESALFIEPGGENLEIGESINLSLEDDEGEPISAVIWASENPSVGTISPTGRLTAVSVGRVTIFAIYFSPTFEALRTQTTFTVDSAPTPTTPLISYDTLTGQITGNPGDEVEVSVGIRANGSTQTNANISINSSTDSSLGIARVHIDNENPGASSITTDILSFDIPPNGIAFLSGTLSSEFGFFGVVTITISVEDVFLTRITFDEEVGNHTSSDETRFFLH